jgi:hypothetical protein
MFALGCQADPYLIGQVAPSMGRVYVLEALATIAGGIPFTYLSITYLYSLQIVLLLSGLNLLSAGLVWGWPDVATTKRLGLNLRPMLILALLAVTLAWLFSARTKEAQERFS